MSCLFYIIDDLNCDNTLVYSFDEQAQKLFILHQEFIYYAIKSCNISTKFISLVNSFKLKYVFNFKYLFVLLPY
jgi:hypothetical protein